MHAHALPRLTSRVNSLWSCNSYCHSHTWSSVGEGPCAGHGATHRRSELCWFHLVQSHRNSPWRGRSTFSSMHELSISAQIPERIHLRPKTKKQLGSIFFFFNYYFLLYISASVHHSHCRAITAATHAPTIYTIYTVQGGLLLRSVAQTRCYGAVRPRLLALLLPG